MLVVLIGWQKLETQDNGIGGAKSSAGRHWGVSDQQSPGVGVSAQTLARSLRDEQSGLASSSSRGGAPPNTFRSQMPLRRHEARYAERPR